MPDADGDGYFASPNPETETSCDGPSGFAKYEYKICDCPVLKEGEVCTTVGGQLTNNELGMIYDPNRYPDGFFGKDFNPNMPEVPCDWIDQDCDMGSDCHLTYSPSIVEQIEYFLGLPLDAIASLCFWGAFILSLVSMFSLRGFFFRNEPMNNTAKRTLLSAFILLVIEIYISLMEYFS